MAVTATTVAAATTMLAAVAAIFLTLVLCFYLFLCAKRYRGGGLGSWLRAAFGGGGPSSGGPADAAWCYDGGLDEKSMAKLPRREVGEGEAALDCAVCIAEVAPGETARVLPRCGHAFHVDCVDMWLRSHSTCPLCRRPAVDDPPIPPPPVPAPEADPESPNFPTNVLFFGSHDEVITGRPQPQSQLPAAVAAPSSSPTAQDQRGLRRLIACGGASPPPQPPHHQYRHHEDTEGDIEMGLAGGESSASRPVKPPQPGS